MHRKRYRTLLQIVVVLAILYFWGQALAANWQQLTTYPWRFSWPPLLLCLLVLLAQLLLIGTIWWRALTLVGSSLPWRPGLSLWLQAQIARYIPGGVWDIAGRLVLGQRAGVDKRTMSASVGLEMGLQGASAAIYMVIALLLRSDATPALYLPLALALTAVALLGLTPPVFSRLVNGGLRLLRRPPLAFKLGYGDILQLFLARFFAHALKGLAFLLFAQSLAPVPWSLAPLFIAAYVGAWLVGYLAILAPTGIGVREGVLVLLIGGQMPFGVVTVAALGYRLAITVRDFLGALLGLLLAPTAEQAPGEPSLHPARRSEANH
jgi:hypothetical protein